jgi:hypothetical protein
LGKFCFFVTQVVEIETEGGKKWIKKNKNILLNFANF